VTCMSLNQSQLCGLRDPPPSRAQFAVTTPFSNKRTEMRCQHWLTGMTGIDCKKKLCERDAFTKPSAVTKLATRRTAPSYSLTSALLAPVLTYKINEDPDKAKGELG
jgi:hypothetical protein